jgi:predicted CXXCH cytochrome family protein
MQTTLASGETLYLTVDPAVYNASIHGSKGYACIQCHTDISGFPHPEITAQTARDYTLEMAQSCAGCHPSYYDATLDGVHQQALAGGNKEAAVCSDCHGAHNVEKPGEPRSNIPRMCERCHSQIFNLYRESVHGAALIGEGNQDVPSCTDCHGVHNVQGPSTGPFHLYSPTLCAKCHANPELMNKYGVSTNVFNSYIADFHGTTVTLFEKTAPGQETNKAVCVDCHGVHDIAASDDPVKSLAVRENLLATCQKCHPDATTNFPDAWLSHYEPSAERFPLVYFVDLFYMFFIPGVLGPMTIFVLTDAYRKIRNRTRKEPTHE